MTTLNTLVFPCGFARPDSYRTISAIGGEGLEKRRLSSLRVGMRACNLKISDRNGRPSGARSSIPWH